MCASGAKTCWNSPNNTQRTHREPTTLAGTYVENMPSSPQRSVSSSSDQPARDTNTNANTSNGDTATRPSNTDAAVTTVRGLLDSYRSLSSEYRANHLDTKRLFQYTTELHGVLRQISTLPQKYSGQLVGDAERQKLQQEHTDLMQQVQRLQSEWPALSETSVRFQRELSRSVPDAADDTNRESDAEDSADRDAADDRDGGRDGSTQDDTTRPSFSSQASAQTSDDQASADQATQNTHPTSDVAPTETPSESPAAQSSIAETESSLHRTGDEQRSLHDHDSSRDTQGSQQQDSQDSAAPDATDSSQTSDSPGQHTRVTNKHVTVIPPVSHSADVYKAQPRSNRRRLRLVRRTTDGKSLPVQMFEGVPHVIRKTTRQPQAGGGCGIHGRRSQLYGACGPRVVVTDGHRRRR